MFRFRIVHETQGDQAIQFMPENVPKAKTSPERIVPQPFQRMSRITWLLTLTLLNGN